MTMTGLPIAWSEFWKKLRGCCSREHLGSGVASAQCGDSTGAESLRRPVINAAPAENVSLPL
eukprot:2847613-Pleurochrysis_carterae.AAC.1